MKFPSYSKSPPFDDDQFRTQLVQQTTHLEISSTRNWQQRRLEGDGFSLYLDPRAT